jgi:predicted transcriptional regulator
MHKVDVYLRVRRAVLEWGFRAGVARRLRDKGMPAVEIAEVLDVTRASVHRHLSETEGDES